MGQKLMREHEQPVIPVAGGTTPSYGPADCRGRGPGVGKFSMSPEKEGHKMRFGEHSTASAALSLEQVKFIEGGKSVLMACGVLEERAFREHRSSRGSLSDSTLSCLSLFSWKFPSIRKVLHFLVG